jgi:hypothetical protein
VVPGWQVQAEMEDFRSRLNAIEGVSDVRAYVGRGAWKGGSEETWVVRFNGNGEAKRLIAETGARYGQDAVLIMEPPTPENTHPITELSFDRNLTGAERDGINQRMADLGFGGWTWGVARTERMPLLRVASVPDFGSDDAQHPGLMQALGTELSALGLNPRRDDFQVAVTTAGPGGRVAYDEFINSLTLYKERHHGVNAGVGQAHSPAVGAGERAGQGRAGDLAGRTAGTSGASDEGGRGAGHSHSEGVVTPVLRRFVFRGGPGSGHHGHEGRPGVRGGSLPGEGPTKEELERQERVVSLKSRFSQLEADWRSRYQTPSLEKMRQVAARAEELHQAQLARNPGTQNRPKDYEGLAMALLMLDRSDLWGGDVRRMAEDFKRFATATSAWLRTLPANTKGEWRHYIQSLQSFKMQLDYEISKGDMDAARDRIAYFVELTMPCIARGSERDGVPGMATEDWKVNPDHPVMVKMLEQGGVRGEAVVRTMSAVTGYISLQREVWTAQIESNLGLDSIERYFAEAPEKMADAEGLRLDVGQVAPTKDAFDQAQANIAAADAAVSQSWTLYNNARQAMERAESDALAQGFARNSWEFLDAVQPYKILTAQRADEMDQGRKAVDAAYQARRVLTVTGFEEAKDIVNGALLIPDADRADIRISLDEGSMMSWDAGTRDAQRAAAAYAESWLEEHADASLFASQEAANVTLRNADPDGGTRASYSSTSSALNMKGMSNSSTYLHELGHHIEHKNPAVHEAAVSFLRHRTAGEQSRPLNDIEHTTGYDSWELSKPNGFFDAYVGKVYGSTYNSTEVISMGVERLFSNPAAFQRDDPEHFDLIVSVLEGKWTKPSP